MPVKFKTASGTWAPHNYKPEYLGPLTLRTALAKSINTISAQLVSEMGVEAVVDMMRRLGIRSPCRRACRWRWGPPTSPCRRSRTRWPAFPAGGEQVNPVLITRLIDADGRVLEDHTNAQAPRPPAGSRDGVHCH